jgi:UDP:flavonoid glycosyltransferase YjiC (YdhE family)
MSPKRPIKFIVASNGSHGDVHPFFALARGLSLRDHEVVLLSNERYAHLAEGFGSHFEAADTDVALQKVIDHLDPGRFTSMTTLIEGLMLRPMRPFYEAIVRHHEPGRTVILAFPFILGARLAHDQLDVPFISFNLAPAGFMSALDQPRFGPPRILAHMPPIFHRLMFKLMVWLLDLALKKKVNAFRSELSLPPQKKIWRWTASPQKEMGLFPAWFSGPQRDWPIHAETTDFPLFDGGEEKALEEDLRAFLDEGEKPVIFTAGSPANGVPWFYEAACRACKRTRTRGVLVTRYADQVPADLPPGVIHVSYAPFGSLLPRASAIVHHGGIGTSAQALKAGLPQMVVPWGADQFDNASRLEKLGVGMEVPQKRFIKRGAQALSHLLKDPDIAQRAAASAQHFEGRDEMAYICDRIEAFARGALWGLEKPRERSLVPS